MKVLAIGNSFSQDATRYLHQIAQADNTELKVVNLYIGGCSLERHYNNINNDEKAYEYEMNGTNTGEIVSIKEALESENWNVVTMQQVSNFSVNYDTFQPYLRYLSEYVKQYAPQAEQVLHQTWAYEQGSERLTVELGYNDQSEMFADIKAAYAQAAKDMGGLRIIPSGEAFQKSIKNRIDKLHRDTFHASLGIGRYILGAVWYEVLTGKEIRNNSFCDFDEPIENNLVVTAKKCARKAVEEYENS
ncbi:MAG: DUF4886 domain-containing protein [Eubacteriales bacterium]|nr:DUF4886 domain-containing protein [Eubacteriales bacterium]